ncbi:MAG: hypothetical protein KME45_19230 [Stenomitos rutilans HA7619-LM2]|jgi:hypothetical protein|nr:hypothetical protein [Stenomitos rutilans HA7619-LM2]
MTADLVSPSASFLAVLTKAAVAFQAKANDRPTASAVVNALLQAEKAAKQEHLLYPFEPLLGTWQLCFATGTRKVRRGGIVLGNGFYVPKFAVAQISFQAEASDAAIGKGTIDNQVEVGPVLLRFTGPAHYLGKKNLLAFDFTHVQLTVLSKAIYNGAVPGRKVTQNIYAQSARSLPFFAFFRVTPTLIAARGRGGGLALWVNVANDED